MLGYQGNTGNVLTVFEIKVHVILEVSSMHCPNAACMMILDNNTYQKIYVTLNYCLISTIF